MQERCTTYELTILYVMPSRNKNKICSMRAQVYNNHKIHYSIDIYDAIGLFKKQYKTMNPFDLVFIEYYLDVAEGICLIEEIKKIDPSILVVACIKSSHSLARFRKKYPNAKHLPPGSAKKGIDYNRIMEIAVDTKLDQLVNEDKEQQEIFVLCSFHNIRREPAITETV